MTAALRTATAVLIAATVAAACASGLRAVNHWQQPDTPIVKRTAPAAPVCHPVDSSDAVDDQAYGEQETLDDEGEIGCVGKRGFRVLRRQLGLKGKP